MVTMTFIWNTQADERVCPLCGPLHGHKWMIQSGEPFPTTLNAGTRTVWNTWEDHSLAHGGSPRYCRCFITWDVDLSKLESTLTKWNYKLQQKLEALPT